MQVLLFAIIASNTKLNAPFANTYLSVIRQRWGKLAHCIFMFFALGTNVLVSSMLVLGGSSTVNHLSGMPVLAACFLTPIGIAIYVMLGGLRSSLIADYIHTSVLIAIILAFALTVYGTSDKIGSFAKMYELLEKADPVQGNAGGSYLTFRSQSAFEFGLLNILGNFSTVFLDQAYFQRAVASKGDTATKGFLLGGIAWFAVPMTIASSLGLAGRALVGQDPDMAVLTASQVSQGLPAPATKQIWEAKTRVEWERAYNIYLAEWMEPGLAIDELWPMPADMNESDIARRRSRVDHWLEGIDSYGTMLYAVTSCTHGG